MKALLRISWPDKALWQNSRAHWSIRAKMTKLYRTEAWGAALSQNVHRLDTTTPRLVFSFHPPKGPGRLPDCQNLPATQKASIDGIADAMGCDDSGFRCFWPETLDNRVEGGCVLIEISEG